MKKRTIIVFASIFAGALVLKTIAIFSDWQRIGLWIRCESNPTYEIPLSLALFTAFFLASCAEEPPQRPRQRVATRPQDTRRRNSRSIQTDLVSLPAAADGDCAVTPHGCPAESAKGDYRTEFPSLANLIWWKVPIHLASTSMWKDSLQERK